MGVLLAIPPDVTAESLGITTVPGKKLFKALQDYGGYLVDDTGWTTHAVAVEEGVEVEFEKKYGYGVDQISGPYYNDFMSIFQNLNIVTNNSANSIGGGGTQRRAPLAPPFIPRETKK